MVSAREGGRADKGAGRVSTMVNRLVWENFVGKGPYQQKHEGGEKEIRQINIWKQLSGRLRPMNKSSLEKSTHILKQFNMHCQTLGDLNVQFNQYLLTGLFSRPIPIYSGKSELW